VRWFVSRWLPAALLGLFISYLLALTIFLLQANSLLQQARVTFDEFKVNGITREVQNSLGELIPRAESIRQTAGGPLIQPFIALSGQEDQIELAFNLFDYLAPALPAIADFAGVDEPKRYLVAFQNSAEARGTGGIIGAFAVLNLDKGQINIERVGSNYILQHQPEIPIKMPQEFVNIYRSDPAIWMNSNLSPHYPYGARIWLALWEKQFAENLDGVITLDPIVLSHLLTVIGPIEVQGKEINSENVVRESLSDAYLRYEEDNMGRKRYLVEIIEGVANAILAPDSDKARLAWSLVRPILDNRVLLYSTDKEVQETLNNSKISGVMSRRASNEYRLVIQNTAGNKMDYYLDRQMVIASKSCRKSLITEVQFKVTNSAREDEYLPAYVKGRLDLDLPGGLRNSTAVTVFLYGPPNAKLVAAMDQESGGAAGFIKRERDRQALVVPLDLAAGQSRSFVVNFKGGQGPITTHIQPLVRDQKTQIVDKCNR